MALWRHHMLFQVPAFSLLHEIPPIFPTFTNIFSIFSLSSVDNFNFLLDAILQ